MGDGKGGKNLDGTQIQKPVQQQQNIVVNVQQQVDPLLVQAPVIQQAPVEKKISDGEYYERMLTSSQNKELVGLILDDNMADLSKVKWAAGTSDFKQMLPVAKQDDKGRDIESASVKEARKTCGIADLCTVREKAALTEYFSNWENEEGPKYIGNDAPNDPQLTKFVDSILSVDFGAHMLTDDYISEHAAELYEYTRKLSSVQSMKEHNPEFYNTLAADKKDVLEMRASMAKDLETLLSAHLELHGVRISLYEKDKDQKVKLIPQGADKEQMLKEYEGRLQDYRIRREGFIAKHIETSDITLAEMYTKGEAVSGEQIAKDLKVKIGKNKGARESCGPEMDAALEEIKRSQDIRNQLIVRQKRYLRKLDSEFEPKELAKVRREITFTNRQIRLATQHADRYREFVSFSLGEVPMVSAETGAFLEKEGQTDMLTVIRFKAAGDCIEKVLAANERKDDLEHIRDLRRETDPDEQEEAKEEAQSLEQEIEEDLKDVSFAQKDFYKKLAAFKKNPEKYGGDPIKCLLDDKKIKDNAADLYRLVMEKRDPLMKKILEPYSREKMGFGSDNPDTRSDRKTGDVSSCVGGHLSAVVRDKLKEPGTTYHSEIPATETAHGDPIMQALRHVEFDNIGQVKGETMENHAQNIEDLRDYNSGDEERVNAVLKRLTLEMINFEVTIEMKDIDSYLNVNEAEFARRKSMLKRARGLRGLYLKHRDFFDGDALTNEQKTHLKDHIFENEYLTNILAIVDNYKVPYNPNPDGKPIEKQPEIQKELLHDQISKEKESMGFLSDIFGQQDEDIEAVIVHYTQSKEMQDLWVSEKKRKELMSKEKQTQYRDKLLEYWSKKHLPTMDDAAKKFWDKNHEIPESENAESEKLRFLAFDLKPIEAEG